MTISNSDTLARENLAAAHRLTVKENYHEGAWNHFSVKRPGKSNQIFLTPGHVHWEDVCASNLLLMGTNHEILEGETDPNVAAWLIHYPLQQARPDLECFMHVHTPYATALSMRLDIKFNDRASQAAAQFYDRVAYFDTYDGSFEDEEGTRMAEALGNKSILVMRNHGICVGGKSIGHAWFNLYLFERACMFQMLAQNGPNATLALIEESVAQTVADYGDNEIWAIRFENLKKWLQKTDSSYQN